MIELYQRSISNALMLQNLGQEKITYSLSTLYLESKLLIDWRPKLNNKMGKW